MRRVRALICLTLFAMAPALRAADYPTRPIRFVVPYVAGGPTDVLGRMVADHLTRDLKQTVFIENKGGAQGAIGAELVAHADPDGYTVLFTASSVLELNPMLYKKLAYDPDRELQVIAIVSDLPSVMVVHPSVPAKTIAEFVAYARQNPGKVNFGSAGTGGVGHLSGEMLKQMAGIEMTSCALQGRRARACRPYIRSHPGDIRNPRHRAAADQGRTVAAARGQLERTRPGFA